MVVTSIAAVLLLQLCIFCSICASIFLFYETKVFVLLRKVNHVVTLFAVFLKQFAGSTKNANFEFMQL